MVPGAARSAGHEWNRWPYPSRFVSGLTAAVHRRFPQREQRIRFTTVTSNASQPARAAKVLGCAIRV
jgi:hypothetical protein